MSGKRAARRRAAKIRGKAKTQALSPEQEAGISTVALLLAMGATDPATVYVAHHGPCAICRVRVGAVAVRFVDADLVAQS